MAEITELVTKFLFKGSLDPLQKYNHNLGSAVKKLAVFATASIAAASAVSAFVISAAEAMESQISLSKETGLSVQKIRELTYVAGQFGISAQTAEGSISSLSKKIGEAATLGNADFARLGISVRDANGHVKNAAKILTELRGSFKRLNLSRSQEVSFAQSMGLDARFVEVLDLSDDKFNQLTKTVRSFGTVTKEQAESLESINQNLATMKFGFSALRTQIAVALAPTFARLTAGFSDFMRSHSKGIAKFFADFGEIVVSLAGAISRLMPVILSFAAAFVVCRIAAVGLAEALGVIFSPVVIAVAVVSGLLLVLDDLIVAFDGGKSAIRDWWFALTGLDLAKFGQGVKDLVDSITKPFVKFFNFVVDGFKKISDLSQSVRGMFGGRQHMTAADKQAAQKLKAIPLPTWGTSQARPVANTNSHVTQHVAINIKSNDPHRTAHEVKTVLNGQLRYAQGQYAVGGV